MVKTCPECKAKMIMSIVKTKCFNKECVDGKENRYHALKLHRALAIELWSGACI